MRIAATVAIVFFSASSHAFVYCDDPARWQQLYKAQKERRQAMLDRRFGELDRHFNAVLASHEARRISDAEVNVEFKMFAAKDIEREPLHVEWIKSHPKSRAARLAHAYYWTDRGYAARGREVAGKTSDIQFATMEQAFHKALEELEASESMARRPTTEWGRKIYILQTFGRTADERASALYSKAMAKYPESLLVRAHFAHASMPQWGGSIERLDRIRSDAGSLPPDSRRYVQWMVDVSIAQAHEFLKDPERAVPFYERAIPACPALTDAAEGLMRIHAGKQNYAGVIAAASHYLERYQQVAWVWRYRGWAYGSSGKLDEAFRDYERAHLLGDKEAWRHLAAFYEKGLGSTKKDPRKAIDIYMAAHSRGVAGARAEADRLRAATGLK